MPTVAPPAKVLVSGANGYIAVWVVRVLLEQGYAVRGTVRAQSKGTHLLNLFKKEVESGKFELVVVPDITAPGAFDEAVKGVDAIEHTASPFHYKAQDPNELIEPAVKGTLGILESARKHAGPQLKRVAVTSSVAAIYSAKDTGLLNESKWNEASIVEVREKGRASSQADWYLASKSLAEKAAWDFVSTHRSSLTWDLVTLLPSYVYGPLLNEVSSPSALGTSAGLFYEALLSKTKTPEELAGAQGGWVDVRDVALGHVRALQVPEAGGQRFILNSGTWIWQDWFDAANALNLPGLDFPKGTPGTGKTFQYQVQFDTSKTRTVLGIEFRDKPTTTKDSIEDFKARGW